MIETPEGKKLAVLLLTGSEAWDSFRASYLKSSILDTGLARELPSDLVLDGQELRSPRAGQLIDFRKHNFAGVDNRLSFTNCEFYDRVDFSGMEFQAKTVDFSGTIFHQEVYFDHVRFCTEVTFENTEFRGGVSFRAVHFRGNATFSEAVFCGDRAQFSGAEFNNLAILDGVEFKCHYVDFEDCKFRNSVNFERSQFSPDAEHDGFQCFDFSNITVVGQTFTFEGASFNGTQPEAGSQHTGRSLVFLFIGAHLETANLNFYGAKVSWTRLDLAQTTLKTRTVNFDSVRGIHSDLIFDGATIAGSLMFTPEVWEHGGIFSLRDVVIEGQLTISKLSGQLVPDLCGTRLAHPLDIHRIDCYSRRKAVTGVSKPPDSKDSAVLKPDPVVIQLLSWLQQRAAPFYVFDDEDAARFRRLKILATEAGDHRQALDFNAKEQRAGYWHDIRGWRLVLHGLYDDVSGYGQFVKRPLLYLLTVTLLFFSWYLLIGTAVGVEAEDFTVGGVWAGALDFALAHVVPFNGANINARTAGATLLFGADPLIPWFVNILAMLQAVISVVLLFLIGLGLRNLFRLR